MGEIIGIIKKYPLEALCDFIAVLCIFGMLIGGMYMSRAADQVIIDIKENRL